MMINQISVFLENKFGKLNEVLSVIKNEQIRVYAANIADTSDYGILRIVTSDQQKTLSLLRASNISASMNEVVAVYSETGIAGFSDTIEHFTKAGISIDYMYTFTVAGKPVMVIRTSNMDSACDVIRKNGLSFVSENDLVAV